MLYLVYIYICIWYIYLLAYVHVYIYIWWRPPSCNYQIEISQLPAFDGYKKAASIILLVLCQLVDISGSEIVRLT